MANWFTDAWFKVTTGKTASQIEAETAANNAILDARNEELRNRGTWTQQDYDVAMQQRSWETYASSPGADVATAAAEGAAEGLEAMQTAVKDTVTGAATFSLRAVFGFIPWWVWLLAIGYGAFRLGLLGPALKSLKIKLP